jgi:hypothetical protein
MSAPPLPWRGAATEPPPTLRPRRRWPPSTGPPPQHRWSEAWGGLDAGDTMMPADQSGNPLAAALKRFGSAPSAALAAAAAAAATRSISLPGADGVAGAAAGLYGMPAVPARAGRASSAAGEDRDTELDAAAQNLRLRSKRDATPNTCVYVGFLGWWVTEKELEACFAPHGKLVSVRVSAAGRGAMGPRGWGGRARLARRGRGAGGWWGVRPVLGRAAVKALEVPLSNTQLVPRPPLYPPPPAAHLQEVPPQPRAGLCGV